MKKPLFNKIERQIISEDQSLYASSMKLHIATKKFEKAFMETFVGRLVKYTVNWIARLLS